jgi:hypothetical protein
VLNSLYRLRIGRTNEADILIHIFNAYFNHVLEFLIMPRFDQRVRDFDRLSGGFVPTTVGFRRFLFWLVDPAKSGIPTPTQHLI